MDLYWEILAHFLENEEMHITFPNLKMDANTIVEMESYQALKKIKAVLEEERLEDAECFTKIEEIICILESYGSGGGSRHDYG